jgi:diguanylate cyclase (GGDEF)-like protein
MTGLHNRRFLERYLRSPVERAPVSVATLLVDLDNLKEINDTFGHTAGDAAITAVARALREVTRPQDVVVRLGGDEFLAVIPGQSSASGLRVAERVIDYVSRIRLPEPWQEIAISVSVGVSSSEPHHIPLERLDTALYAAKRTGKGRACLLEVA